MRIYKQLCQWNNKKKLSHSLTICYYNIVAVSFLSQLSQSTVPVDLDEAPTPTSSSGFFKT